MSQKSDLFRDLEPELKRVLGEVSPKTYRIVCLDDDADLVETTTAALGKTGLTVFGTTSPQEAIEYVRKYSREVALVVSDFKMPEMDGFGFRDALSKVNASVPFVILSGFVDKDMALRGLDLKIAAFLAKPLAAAEFTDVFKKKVLSHISSLKDDLEMLNGFLGDAQGMVVEMEDLTMELEKEPSNRALLDSIFGITHTIKGTSGFFEPKTLHKFAHKFEDRLKKVQERGSAQPNEIRTIFFAADTIKTLLGSFSSESPDYDLEKLLADLEMAGAAAPADETAAAGPTAAASAPKEKRESAVKVESWVLDDFLRATGELTIIRSMLKKTAQVIDKKLPRDSDSQQLSDLIEELNNTNALIQKRVTDIRKVSLAAVFKPFARIVRDVSKTLKKEVRLELVGENQRIDLMLAEVLNKSLVHLLKNSIDHGLESPEKREANGKPREGRIQIIASVTDEFVTIEIVDDGQGLNASKIRAKLLEKNFDAEKVNAMSDVELHQMIFAPGFSTAAQTTELSGRGVGMSMVEETVKAVGGTLHVISDPPRETRFVLHLPAPKFVLIKRCLFVRIGSQRFGLDLDYVSHVVDLNEAIVMQSQGNEMIDTGRGLTPLVRASTIFDQAEGGEKAVLIESDQHAPYALVVDEILEFADVVIKPLPPLLKGLDVYQGATLLEDRSVGLLLDANGLAKRASITSHMSRKPALHAVKAKTETSTANSWMVVTDMNGSHVAIPQDLIVRVEIVNESMVKTVGATETMNFQMRSVPIYGRGRTPSSGFSTIVVFREGEKIAGFRIQSVVDILDAKTAPEEGAVSMILGDRVVQLFRAERVLRVA